MLLLCRRRRSPFINGLKVGFFIGFALGVSVIFAPYI
jgi:hypothetical protein